MKTNGAIPIAFPVFLWKCKHCEHEFSIINHAFGMWGHWGNGSFHPFCPNCGKQDTDLI